VQLKYTVVSRYEMPVCRVGLNLVFLFQHSLVRAMLLPRKLFLVPDQLSLARAVMSCCKTYQWLSSQNSFTSNGALTKFFGRKEGTPVVSIKAQIEK